MSSYWDNSDKKLMCRSAMLSRGTPGNDDSRLDLDLSAQAPWPRIAAPGLVVTNAGKKAGAAIGGVGLLRSAQNPAAQCYVNARNCCERAVPSFTKELRINLECKRPGRQQDQLRLSPRAALLPHKQTRCCS